MTQSEKDSMLSELRSKYAKLDDLKKVIAHMQALCENSEYLLQCLNTSIQRVKSVTTNYQIPNYQETFDEALEPLETNGSYNSGLNSDLVSFREKLPTAGHLLDDKMTETAHRIEYVKNIEVSESDYIMLGIRG